MSEYVESEQSSTIGALAAALAKAQGQMRNAKKDSVNPHFKSNYADLASVIDACREALSINSLAFVQRVTSCPEGVKVTTTLMHSSGEWMRDACVMPVAQRTPQGMGSAITYGRRYGLSAMVGVAAEDDDGQEASRTTRQPPTQRPSSSPEPVTRSTVQSKTEAAKAKVRAKMQVVDVQPGETEAEATARETTKPEEPGPWEKIQVLAQEYGVEGFTMASVIKGATGKADRKQIVASDVPLVQGALEQRRLAHERERASYAPPEPF